MTRVIGLLSGKGGVGKTTITANLGVALAYDYNKRVIAIDANTTSCCLSFHLGRHNYKITLNEVLKKIKNISDAIYFHPSRLYIVPSSQKLKNLDANPYDLKENVNILMPHADIILLDGAPTLGAETHAVLEACDEVIIITNLETPSISEASRLEKLALAKKKKILGIVVNRARRSNKRLLEKLKKEVKAPVLGIVSEDDHVYKSIEEGVPVIHFYPNSTAARNLRGLVEKIAGEEFPNNGFFSKFAFLFNKFRKNKLVKY